MLRITMIAAAALASTASAQAAESKPWTLQAALDPPKGLTVSGSVRARYEAIDNNLRPGFRRDEDVLSFRSSLFAEYRTGGFRIGGELNDGRVYGTKAGTTLNVNDVNTMEPVQAYIGADLGAPFGRGSALSVQLGRIQLALGSRRLVTADEYRNTTAGHTGIRFDARAEGGLAATLIYVMPHQRRPDDPASMRDNEVAIDVESEDLTLFGGLVSKAGLPDKATVEAVYFGLDERDAFGRPTRNRNLHTYGGRLLRAPESGRLDYELEGYLQSGTIRESLAPAARLLDVSASFVHAEAGWTWGGAWKPHLAVEYDRASGDRAPASSTASTPCSAAAGPTSRRPASTT